jgi:long-chain acyl-CoA synthetase
MQVESRGELAELFRRIASTGPDAIAVYSGTKEYTRGVLNEAAISLWRALDDTSIAADAGIGWIARNDPSAVAGLLGIVLADRCVSLINPHEPPAKVAEGLRSLNPAVIVACERDWTADIAKVAEQTQALGLIINLDKAQPVRIIDNRRFGAPKPNHHSVPKNIAIELLTSGTTGDPKRIQVAADGFLQGLSLGTRKDRKGEGAPPDEMIVKKSPTLVFNPLAHVGGFFYALLALKELRPMVLRERFVVHEFVADMRLFRPKVISLVPAMAAMVLEKDVPAEVFSSVLVVRSGTAPLAPDIKEKFESRYRVPILSEYGASEFFGGVTVWTMGDYEKFGAAKSRSVGRIKADVEFRIVDLESDTDVLPGGVGILVLKSKRFAPGWHRTTDLVSCDSDGFIFIHGRSDQAINRGGFKILPEKVAEVYRRHPAVAEICVLGAKDARLGQIPVAVIEVKEGQARPSPSELEAFGREHLTSYQVPAAFEFMEALPRTPSMKVASGKIREQLSDRYAF